MLGHFNENIFSLIYFCLNNSPVFRNNDNIVELLCFISGSVVSEYISRAFRS